MCITILAVNNKGADQTAWMRRLICVFVVRIWHKTGFLMTWLLLFIGVGLLKSLSLIQLIHICDVTNLILIPQYGHEFVTSQIRSVYITN